MTTGEPVAPEAQTGQEPDETNCIVGQGRLVCGPMRLKPDSISMRICLTRPTSASTVVTSRERLLTPRGHGHRRRGF